jgi:hypothetical protein
MQHAFRQRKRNGLKENMASSVGHANPRVAAACRGRASVTVERYAHLAIDHLAKAANRIDSLLDGCDFGITNCQKSTTSDNASSRMATLKKLAR